MLPDSMRRKTQVNLVGGLGNQLFGYFAGSFLGEICGHQVVFNTWHIPRGLTDHGVSIEGRGLPGVFVSRPPSSGWARLSSKPFKSKVLGWDPSLQNLSRGAVVEGYFQTWKYVRALRRTPFSSDMILLKGGRSAWLTYFLRLAATEKPVILHFRRGDYRKVPEAMGLLYKDYYQQAISNLPDSLQDSPVWVFSDEPNLAREFFADLNSNFLFIDPPPHNDPGESLFLMTQGVAHIISNSTFAWWGAFLSKTSNLVIAPSPWLRSYEAPLDFFPEGWVLLEHQWGSE